MVVRALIFVACRAALARAQSQGAQDYIIADIFDRIGAHLPEDDRERLVLLEVAECNKHLKLVVDAMRSLFEELGLEDMRKV